VEVVLAPTRVLPRLPPNFFSIAFGLSGLGLTWRAAQAVLRTPAGVADGIFILTAVVWLVLLGVYLANGPRLILADLADAALSPFVSLGLIVPLILTAQLAPYALTAARALVLTFLAAAMILGGLLSGQWIAGTMDLDSAHPGYFLPTVAVGFTGATFAAELGFRGIAIASFGVGVICWLLLSSVVLGRLFFRPMLPPPLVPTLTIELAPPALAGVAYFALTGPVIGFVARVLGGYVVLMALVQLRLVPLYARLKFSVGFWAFAFSFAAVGVDALLWIAITRPAGATGYAIAVVTLITVLLVSIAARTIIAMARGSFLPAPAPAPAAQPLASSTEGGSP
jgi:tellurite resistance protein